MIKLIVMHFLLLFPNTLMLLDPIFNSEVSSLTKWVLMKRKFSKTLINICLDQILLSHHLRETEKFKVLKSDQGL